MHLSFVSAWFDPPDIPGEPTVTQREWYSFGTSFFPKGKGSCLVLEISSLDFGDIPTGFVRVLISDTSLKTKLFRAILFYFDAKFNVVVVYTFP